MATKTKIEWCDFSINPVKGLCPMACLNYSEIWVNQEWLSDIFSVVKNCDKHTFIFLTKQPRKLKDYLQFPDNAWIGVSAWDSDSFDNAIQNLREVNAKVKFISLEPLLDWTHTNGLKYPLALIQWIIIGQQTTCLWLKGLPPLFHLDKPNLFGDKVTHVGKGKMHVTKSGVVIPEWYSMLAVNSERQKLRSRTFSGITIAMAEQWASL